jgi:hypothetical protein
MGISNSAESDGVGDDAREAPVTPDRNSAPELVRPAEQSRPRGGDGQTRVRLTLWLHLCAGSERAFLSGLNDMFGRTECERLDGHGGMIATTSDQNAAVRAELEQAGSDSIMR